VYCRVLWRTIENHVVDFRGSDDFGEWRKLTAHCFADVPVIKNWDVAVAGFGFEPKMEGAVSATLPGRQTSDLFDRLDPSSHATTN
jgi:hypothetical protein